MLATSAMPPKMMVKWLQRWNPSAAIRFSKTNFVDSKFPERLNRATWWAHVSIHLQFHIFISLTPNELWKVCQHVSQHLFFNKCFVCMASDSSGG